MKRTILLPVNWFIALILTIILASILHGQSGRQTGYSQGSARIKAKAESDNAAASDPETIRVETDAAGFQELAVCDVLGRVIRRLASGWFDAASREQSWDGLDDAGARVPAGVYYARLRTAAGIARSPVVRLE